jgi:cation diffusion facilitator family transporter
MADCSEQCGSSPANTAAGERRILVVVLLINATMFVAEFSAGLLAGSTALLADSLDMLADAIVYAIGLMAVGRAGHWRTRAALTSGLFQMALGAGIAIEAMVKIFVDGLPDTATMGFFGVLALAANTVCFVLLTRFREGDINLRATWICSRNDMIGNVGVLMAALLVTWLQSGWPDILIGLVIALIVMRSAYRIGAEAYARLGNGDD